MKKNRPHSLTEKQERINKGRIDEYIKKNRYIIMNSQVLAVIENIKVLIKDPQYIKC